MVMNINEPTNALYLLVNSTLSRLHYHNLFNWHTAKRRLQCFIYCGYTNCQWWMIERVWGGAGGWSTPTRNLNTFYTWSTDNFAQKRSQYTVRQSVDLLHLRSVGECTSSVFTVDQTLSTFFAILGLWISATD